MRTIRGKFSLVSVPGRVTLLQGNKFDFHLVNVVNPVTNYVSLNLFAAKKFSAQSVTHVWQKTAQPALNVQLSWAVSFCFQTFFFPITPISWLLNSHLIGI